MEAMEWITMFLITGLCTSPSFGGQYRQHCLVATPKTWSEAQSYCREKGQDLATIDDLAGLKALLPLVVNHNQVWIGIHIRGPRRWFWSLADHHFNNENEKMYRNAETLSVWYFAVSSKDGIWSSTRDHYKKCSFICYDENKQGRDRYVLVLQALTAMRALDYCRAHNTDLVSIRNQTENQVVHEVAAGNEVWIGLFSDRWSWSDGRSTTFRFWNLQYNGAYTRDDGCGVMQDTNAGKWAPINCSTKRSFLCTCGKVRVPKVKVRSEDLQDLNDLATKAAILTNMQQLMDKANAGHKLTWSVQPDGQVFTREQSSGHCDSLN